MNPKEMVPPEKTGGATEPENRSPEEEHRNHRYVGHTIPWFIHVLWISFWVFAVGYTLVYVFPAIQKEWFSPP